MPESRRLVFFDTVTLSNFALAESLDLLVRRYGRRLMITSQVLVELDDGIAAGHSALRAVRTAVSRNVVGFASLTEAERDVYLPLLAVLGQGEASCVACAAGRDGVVASDDRAARACCRERNVPFTGTIGILKACCEQGMIAVERA